MTSSSAPCRGNAREAALAPPSGRRNRWRDERDAEPAADYFTRWMKRFPTLEALAAADQQDVLKAWEGLGYYARARNLHRRRTDRGGDVRRAAAARAGNCSNCGNRQYSASAILSLAFGLHEPILDGNVKHVFSRLADIDSPIDEHRASSSGCGRWRGRWWKQAEGQASVVNEALMELETLVCTPGRAASGLPAATCAPQPRTVRRRSVSQAAAQDAALRCGGGRHLARQAYASPARRSLSDRRMACWAGCGSFPAASWSRTTPICKPACAARSPRSLPSKSRVHEPLTTVRHAYTHFRITLHAFHARWLDGVPQALGCADWRWARLDQLAEYPFPVTDQKIIQSLAQAEESP